MSTGTIPLSAWQRIRRWWQGRNWSLLILGAPALLVFLGFTVFVWLSATTSQSDLLTRYQTEGKAAAARGDHARAMSCFERVVAAGSSRPEVLWRLALSAEHLGQTNRALGLMSELAPPDRVGYAPGHFWWARQLLLLPEQTDRTRSAAQVHLVRALDGELDDREAAHALLGQVFVSRGLFDEAEPHLVKAVKTRPYLRLWLARLYARRKDTARARQEAELAIRFYQSRAKGDLKNHEARLAWADAVTFLEDYPEAVRILEEGLLATRSGIYRAALARIYLAWHDSLDAKEAKEAKHVRERIGLLQKGLTQEPANKDLLDRLLGSLRTKGTSADEARKILRSMLTSGNATAYTHFALSVDALEQGRQEEGLLHLEAAYRADPTLKIVTNNLAWILAQQPSPDLARARQLANLAVNQDPSNPNYRDTRGRILMKMGLWKDALADLEFILPQLKGNADLHRALAEIYDRLGHPTLAEEHRQLARAGKPTGRP